MAGLTEYYPQFFTATILDWKHLLRPDKYKKIITNSLDFLVAEKRVAVYGFVIMPNHMHLVWHIGEGWKLENVQRDFLKFTAQQIKFDLKECHPDFLEKFKVNAKDRTYQMWERNSLSVDICSEKVMRQKLNYIHNNPAQQHWNLCKDPVDYRYSSASFYETGGSEWKFLTHYLG
jgi:putative transposase